jgi:hypothetical protein
MRVYAVAPIQYRGVAMRHVGPWDATRGPLPISTWTASPRRAFVPQTRVRVELRTYMKIRLEFSINNYMDGAERG